MADDFTELRELHAHDTAEWQAHRKEGDKDMLCVAGEIWQAMDPASLKARQEDLRPALNLDEIGQYVNQLVNDIRANKRAVKITPIGSGANDEFANARANLIRQIEYRSNAASDAYTVMFENAVQRSFGALRIVAEYEHEQSFNQELLVKAIYNPNQLTPDAESVEPTGADMRHCFYDEWWSRKAFQRRFPKAKISDVLLAEPSAPLWLRPDSVRVSEFWEVTERDDTLVLLKDGATIGLASELKPKPSEIQQSRPAVRRRVVQRLTNGFENLGEPVEWLGKDIPFVLCFGKVLYLDEGGGTKKRLMSLVRLMRDPAMYYAYLRTCEAEAIGGVPRSQWVGYAEQFKGFETRWKEASRKPVAYLEANATSENTGQNVLPLPTRVSWDPPLQNLEIAGEGARRAIQSAAGSNFLPTDAQNRNQKSGKALEKIQSQSQRGSYHFVDHFEASVARVGVLLNDLIPHYYDTARDVTVRKPDETAEVLRVNDQNADKPVDLVTGQYDVTISTGPSHDSEREQASDLADTLIGLGPEMFGILGDLAIKLKNVGPLGDEMAARAKMLHPPALQQAEQQQSGQSDPAQMAQALASAQGQIAQLTATAQEMQKQIEADTAKSQVQMEIEHMKLLAQRDLQIELQKMKDATSIRVAEIAAGAKGSADAAAHAAQHEIEAGLAAQTSVENELDRQHEAGMAERAHEQAMEQGAMGVMGDLTMQDRDQAHESDLTDRTQQHEAGMAREAMQGQMQMQKAAAKQQPKGASE